MLRVNGVLPSTFSSNILYFFLPLSVMRHGYGVLPNVLTSHILYSFLTALCEALC